MIQKRNIFFIFSGTLIVLTILSLIFWGMKFGIDFTGGSFIRVDFKQAKPSSQIIQDKLAPLKLGQINVQSSGSSEMTFRLKHIDNQTYQQILSILNENFGQVEEKSFETIGPTIGVELRNRALLAIALVLAFIIIYISFAFRKVSSGPVKSWAYGVGAVIALIHDVLIVIGVFSVLGHFLNVEVDSYFVTALLTVIGFSVHDTIVVYDRIRERLRTSYLKSFEETVNESINQTLIRSINTSLTALFVLTALFLFGGQTIHYFVLALIVGIVVGTYSSIYVASALLVVWTRLKQKVA